MEATLEELGLSKVEFPIGFIPKYYVREARRNIDDGWWVVYDEEPFFDGMKWASMGECYEVGKECDDNPVAAMMKHYKRLPGSSLITISAKKRAYQIRHACDIGDCSAYVAGGQSPAEAIYYLQHKADDHFGMGIHLSNHLVASALIVFYGFESCSRSDAALEVDSYDVWYELSRHKASFRESIIRPAEKLDAFFSLFSGEVC